MRYDVYSYVRREMAARGVRYATNSWLPMDADELPNLDIPGELSGKVRLCKDDLVSPVMENPSIAEIILATEALVIKSKDWDHSFIEAFKQAETEADGTTIYNLALGS